MRNLDLGCGRRRKDHYAGVDRNLRADANLVADLECSLPFCDASFDAVWLSHVFEHIEDTVGLLEEIWRVSKPGKMVEIAGPHFSSPHIVWGDPAHRRGLSLGTFRCFIEESDWFVTSARFEIRSCNLIKGNSSFRGVGRKWWYWPAVIWNKAWQMLANRSVAAAARYERLAGRFIAFEEIRVVLGVIKSN